MTARIRRRPPVAAAAVQVAVGKVFFGAFAVACIIGPGTVSPAHAVPVFREGFESGTSRWTLTGTWGLVSDAHTGSFSLTDSPAGDYANGTDTAATMVSDLNVSAATSRALVSFWLKGQLVSGWDSFTVEASQDGGTTWTGLWSGLRGSNWNQGYQYLSVLGTMTKVRFRLHLVTDASGTADGVYVDDFLVDDGQEYAVITSPNGGEDWAGGSVKNITWTNNSVVEPPASFRLLYSTDGGTSYPNLIASGIPGSATSYAWTVPNLNSWTVRVRIDALDAAGNILFQNTSAWTDTSDANFQIDSTLPSVFDLAMPANGAWCTPTCTFTWIVPEQVTIQLFVDGALRKDNVPLSNPVSLVSNNTYTLTPAEALTQGFHTWYVVAKDAAGNVRQSTSTWSVQVDTVPPTAPTLVAPAANAWVGADSPTFSWTGGSDSGSGLAGFEIWIDGTAAATALPPTESAGQAPIPPKSIFKDSFDTCGGWMMAPIPPSSYNWSCDLQGDINSYALNIYALATSGTIGSTATSGVIDLSNVGHALLALRESICGAKTYQISASDGSAAGFRLVRDTPATSCHWTDTSLPFDDFTGGASSVLQLTGVATPFNAVYLDSLEIQGVTGGSYSWQVVSVDQAGNKTPSESRTFRYDLPPFPFDAIGPTGWSNTATPIFSWNATTDVGSGLAKYQIFVDGKLTVDNIPATTTSEAPTTPIPDGQHSWRAYAVDVAGAVRHSRQTLLLGIDTQLPQLFSLATPSDGTVVTTPTPSLCWNSTGDTGSGLDHYDLLVDGTVVRGNITDLYTGQICATPTAAVAVGAHNWNVKAVDKAGNSRNSTETWTIYFGVVPEPGRDAGTDVGIDAPADFATDGSITTATATGTATESTTATATATSTATGTFVGPEPTRDGSTPGVADAPAILADAPAVSIDAGSAGDAPFTRDVIGSDAPAPLADGSIGQIGADAKGGLITADGSASVVDGIMRTPTSDGSASAVADGGRHDTGSPANGDASGCGCTLGDSDSRIHPWPVALIGFALAWRFGRRRSKSTMKK